jgi:hypothetical protein
MTETGTQHDAQWHLAEAERLLGYAREADEQVEAEMRDTGHSKDSVRRWSYAERARCHIALAGAIAAQVMMETSLAAAMAVAGSDED